MQELAISVQGSFLKELVRMESFFIAETLKYLLLLQARHRPSGCRDARPCQADDHEMKLDRYVFNTEELCTTCHISVCAGVRRPFPTTSLVHRRRHTLCPSWSLHQSPEQDALTPGVSRHPPDPKNSQTMSATTSPSSLLPCEVSGSVGWEDPGPLTG